MTDSATVTKSNDIVNSSDTDRARWLFRCCKQKFVVAMLGINTRVALKRIWYIITIIIKQLG